MSSVTFPVAVGGDGSTVSDDDNATTGLRNGGWRTRFVPCFTNLVNIADYVTSYAALTTTYAEPPPIGSTTPNTGAFTRVTVTGSTAPTNGLFLPSSNVLGFSTNSTVRGNFDASGNFQMLGGLFLGYNANPIVKTTAATLTGAEFIVSMFQMTSTGGNLTIPTGTDIESALPWTSVNQYFDFTLINSTAASISLGLNGNLSIGSLAVAIGSSGRFRCRRTAASTFTIYRLS